MNNYKWTITGPGLLRAGAGRREALEAVLRDILGQQATTTPAKARKAVKRPRKARKPYGGRDNIASGMAPYRVELRNHPWAGSVLVLAHDDSRAAEALQKHLITRCQDGPFSSYGRAESYAKAGIASHEAARDTWAKAWIAQSFETMAGIRPERQAVA